jgi:hypothetical protein
VSDILARLSRRLEAVKDGSAVEHSKWHEWIVDPLGLSPWESWTLLGLIRHRDRQQFVADSIMYRLNAEQDTIAAAGALGHPKNPQQGVVPGLPEWEYFFHGRGCCLTHRISGEAIDVDFYDSSADWTDAFFYERFLQSLSVPQFVEQRLLELHPSLRTIQISIRQLLDDGLLERLAERLGIVRLSFDYQSLKEVLDEVEAKWEDANVKRAIGAAIGDWLLLNELQTDGFQATVIRNRQSCLTKRSDYLVGLFARHEVEAQSLLGLHEIDSPMLEKVLEDALRAEPSGATSAAIEVISKMNHSKWCAAVQELVGRIDPNGSAPRPYLWNAGAEFLLRHGKAAKVKQKLRRLTSSGLGDAAILALEHFPEIAIETFRRALRSEIHINRITAAAALAILDRPWSRNELTAVLSESNEHETTSECRSALLATHSSECHEQVLKWEERNPRIAEQGPRLTVREMRLRMCDRRIQWEMDKLHDRVLKLRGVVPTG